METLLYDAAVVTESGVVPHAALAMDGTKLTNVFQTKYSVDRSRYHTLDCSGLTACPGFIDLHVHGGGGVDFTGAEPDGILEGCMAHARHGATSLVPTTLACPPSKIIRAVQNIQKAQALPGGSCILGAHLEGPFLSHSQGGAQSRDALRAPTRETAAALLNSWSGIRMMGAAPELPGALELGDLLASRGIVASVAHSDADYDACMEALGHGYSDVTHLYSGCSMVHRENGYRHGGVVESALLDDRFTVQIIADGRHLPPELLRLIYKCKGSGRISLITDALFPAGSCLREGQLITQSNGMDALYEDGVMKLPDRQAFAGSVATMDLLVKNMVDLARVPLHEAVRMASLTPARVLGVDGKKGRLAAGFDADVVLLDGSLTVRQVYLAGKPIMMQERKDTNE